MKAADTLGQPSEPAPEHCSGTIAALKTSTHSGVHPQGSDHALQEAADDATRAYDPLEVAELLSAAQKATRSRSEGSPEIRDAARASSPAGAGEATRAYTSAEVANLLSKVPGPTPPDPSSTNVESPIVSLKQDFPAASALDRAMVEPIGVQQLGTLALRLDPTATPINAQQLELAPPLSEVVGAAPPDASQGRLRHHLWGLALACLVGGAAWLALEQSHGAPIRWWRTGTENAAVDVPRLVRLQIEIEPPDATLFLDGNPASNPLRIAYPSNDAIHEIRGEAPGYVSRSASISFDRDVVVVLSLAKAAAD